MKPWGLWVAVLIISVILPCVAAAQEAIPTTTSVGATVVPPLRAGDSFTFQLTLNEPPRRYNEGTIEAWFECEPVSLDLFTGPGEEWCRRPAFAKPVDGQTTYDVNLPISEPMKPGKWRLVSLDLVQAGPHPIAVSGGVTFEVTHLHPMTVADVQPPKSAEAGKQFVIKVILAADSGDTYKDCANFSALPWNGGSGTGERHNLSSSMSRLKTLSRPTPTRRKHDAGGKRKFKSLLRLVRSRSRVLISFSPCSVLPVGNVLIVGGAAGGPPDSPVVCRSSGTIRSHFEAHPLLCCSNTFRDENAASSTAHLSPFVNAENNSSSK